MARRILALCLLALLLTGCAAPTVQTKQTIYEASFLSLFDTVTVVKGPAESKEAFDSIARTVQEDLTHYHQLFDVYNSYEGLNNLKTVNDMAGVAPVKVEKAVTDLLKDCCSYYELSGGKVNVAMGGVLKLWHNARNAGIHDPANAKLPDMAALQAAAEHISFDAVVIDETASTVYISDSKVQLDVGAVLAGEYLSKVEKSGVYSMDDLL